MIRILTSSERLRIMLFFQLTLISHLCLHFFEKLNTIGLVYYYTRTILKICFSVQWMCLSLQLKFGVLQNPYCCPGTKYL